MRRSWFRAIVLPFLLVSSLLMTPLAGGRLTPSFAAVAQVSGDIPWHPHYTARIEDGITASVDLADGHLDLASDELDLPGRGLPLVVHHVWDSVLARTGGGTAGAGLVTNLSQQVSGAPGSNVVYTDPSGAQWTFVYNGSGYTTPAGLPWQLTTSGSSFYLTDILTGEVLAFDQSGMLTSDTDAYGNKNYYPSLTTEEWQNSGGRPLWFISSSQQPGKVLSPLGEQTFPLGTAGQVVAYSYNGTAEQLISLTCGYGSSDRVTTQFAYTGSLLTGVTTPMNQVWAIQYDGSDRVIAITSPVSGTVGQAGYTPSYTTKIVYNAGSTVVTQGYGTSAAVSTTYSLDSQGQAIAVTDGMGDTSYFSYDADHDIASFKDGDGNVTTNHFTYVGSGGSYGLLTETDYPAIHPLYPSNAATAPVTHYVYDPSTNDLTEQYDNYGAYTFYTYDGHHGVSKVAQLTGSTVNGGTTYYHWRGQIYNYDAFGELTGVIDGRGASVPDTTSLATAPSVSANGSAASYTHSLTYDQQGDVQTSATPPITTSACPSSTCAATTTYSYDADGDLTAVQSPDGNTFTYGYDRLGRQDSALEPQIAFYNTTPADHATPQMTVAFDGDGNVAETRNNNEDVTDYSFDPLGRLVDQTSAISGTTLLTYSATNLTSAKDPQGNVATYTYDAAGRLKSERDAAGEEQDYSYDAADNLTGVAYGNGVTASSLESRTYDPLNQLATDTISNTATPAQTAVYSYDLHGNLAREQHPDGSVTFSGYDPVDQLVSREIDKGNPNLPSGTHQETFGYDVAGNQVLQTDYRGAATTFTLDGDNRVRQQVDTFTGQPTITTSMTYDPDGNELSQSESVNGQQHSFTTSYNTVDDPTSTSDDGFTTSYAGDGEGRLLSQTILNGAGTNQRDQDNLGRVFGIEDGTHTTGIAYNADNLPVSVSYPGGASQAAQYDGASRLTQITASGTGISTTYSYGYDPAGWTSSYTTNVTGSTLTQTLTHDALSRLTGASGGTSNGSWSYDGNGNLTQATRNGVTSTYTYSTSVADELASVATTGQSTISYGYDGNGDTTSIVGGSTDTHLVYDAQGRLSSATLANGSTIAMTYNAEGQRATYTVTPQGASQPSLSEHFQYRGGQDTLPAQVAYSGTGVPAPYTDTYLYRQDGTPAELIRQQGGTTTDYWYVLDGRGDVVALADGTGHFVDRYQYDLWGAPVSVSEQVPQQLRYGSYWYDAELGWYWLSVREYDPTLERFLQPDPSEIEGLFSYAYAINDPIDYRDPSGFASCTGTTPAVLVSNTDNTVDADDGACTSPQSQEDLSGSSPEARLATQGLAGTCSANVAPAGESPGEGYGPIGEAIDPLKWDYELLSQPEYVSNEDIVKLRDDSNDSGKGGNDYRITEPNAIRTLNGPEGTTSVKVAGPGVDAPDVMFYGENPGEPLLKRDVKALSPGNRGFATRLREGVNKLQGNGEIWIQVQVPEDFTITDYGKMQYAIAGYIRDYQDRTTRNLASLSNVKVTVFDNQDRLYFYNFRLSTRIRRDQFGGIILPGRQGIPAC